MTTRTLVCGGCSILIFVIGLILMHFFKDEGETPFRVMGCVFFLFGILSAVVVIMDYYGLV